MDEYNQILTDDVLLKDGTIFEFNTNEYLDGLIECEYGQLEYWRHGKLHDNPAVVNADLSHKDIWRDCKLIEIAKV